MPNQESDELQLAANQDGLEAFKANNISSFGEGIGRRAEKLGQGQGTSLVAGSGGSTYQSKGSGYKTLSLASILSMSVWC